MPNPKHLTERVFQAPQKYIQGPNAIKNSAKYLKALGKQPLLTVDDIVFEIGELPLFSAHSGIHAMFTSWKEPRLCTGAE